MKKTIEQITQDGRDAYCEGLELRDNPYSEKKNKEAHVAWEVAWMAAEDNDPLSAENIEGEL